MKTHSLTRSASDTPETDASTDLIKIGLNEYPMVDAEVSRKLERERNKEMGYRSQWCDKAQKLECRLNAALDALDKIESHYVDGDDTYEAWRAMGDIAAVFLREEIKHRNHHNHQKL